MRIVLVLFLALGACRVAPLHRKGDTMWEIRGGTGIPLFGKSLAWDGEYDAESYTLTAGHKWLVSDRIALGAQASGTRWQLPGRHRYGVELLGTCRWFFAELNELEKMGFFFDINGGAVVTNGPFPPLGTPFNFTFEFGPGVEIPINNSTSCIFGIQYHHVSNALGSGNDRNPSQNEVRVWVGVDLLW